MPTVQSRNVVLAVLCTVLLSSQLSESHPHDDDVRPNEVQPYDIPSPHDAQPDNGDEVLPHHFKPHDPHHHHDQPETWFRFHRCPRNSTPFRPALFPHPRDCSKYIKCYWLRSYVLRCPPGLGWNDKIKHCDLPENVKCPPGAIPATPTPRPPPTTTTVSSEVPPRNQTETPDISSEGSGESPFGISFDQSESSSFEE